VPSDDSNEPPLISMDKLVVSESSLNLDAQLKRTTSSNASLELVTTPNGKDEKSKDEKSKDEQSRDEKSKDEDSNVSSAGSTPYNSKRKRT
jgi:hypothetical protein